MRACNEQVAVLRAESETELGAARQATARHRAAADERVQIAMESAMMADQARAEQERHAAERLREQR
jgi:hypothetical protein